MDVGQEGNQLLPELPELELRGCSRFPACRNQECGDWGTDWEQSSTEQKRGGEAHSSHRGKSPENLDIAPPWGHDDQPRRHLLRRHQSDPKGG